MKYPATRKEALKQGSKWYYTGKPCKNNHIDVRLVANFGCKTCLYKKREQYEFSENYIQWKKENKSKVSSNYIKNNLPKVLANTRKYQAAKRKRLPVWVDKTELERIKCLYQVAGMYNKEKLEKWTVDHKIPLQGETVSGLHVFNNLQLMSSSKNSSKSNNWNWNTQDAY
jgi:hypothetical protein